MEELVSKQIWKLLRAAPLTKWHICLETVPALITALRPLITALISHLATTSGTSLPAYLLAKHSGDPSSNHSQPAVLRTMSKVRAF